MHVQSLSWEDPHDEGMATYFSILACPMDRGVGVLQTIESQRARHDWSDLALMHKRAQSGSEVTLVPGSASVALRAGLNIREMDGDESWAATWMYLVPVNGPVNYG